MQDVKVRYEIIDEMTKQSAAIKRNVTGDMSAMSTSSKGLAGALGTVAAAAGGLFVFTKIAGFMKENVRLADVQMKAEAKLAQTIRSTGMAAGFTAGELIKFAQQRQKVTLFGDEQTIEAQNLMLTFTKIGRDVFPQAIVAAQNMSTTIGQDMRSSVTMLGKALNDPVQGITAMSRAGIQFTKDQKDTIKSMVEMGDVTGAQTEILKELETQFGGAAEAAARAGAGPIAQFTMALGDMREEIGKRALPSLNSLATQMKDTLPAVGVLGSAIVSLAITFTGTIYGLFKLVGAGIASVAAFAVIGIGKMLGGISSLIEKLPKKLQPDGWVEGLREAEASVVNFGDTLARVALKQGLSATDSLESALAAFKSIGKEAKAVDEISTTPAGPKPDDKPTSSKKAEKERDISKAVADIQSEFMQIGMAQREKELADLENWYLAKTESVMGNEEAITQAYALYLDKRAQLRLQWHDEDQKLRDERKKQSALERDVLIANARAATIATMQQLKDMTAGQKEYIGLYKTAAITQAGIDTYAAANASYKALAGIPYVGPALGAAAAAIAIAAGLVNVGKIAQLKFAGGGVVGGSSYTGDNVPVMANSGEVFINRAQQSRLLQLASTPMSRGTGGGNLSIDARITIQGNADYDTVERIRQTQEDHLIALRDDLRQLKMAGQF